VRNGTNKSWVLTAVPAVVATVTWPEVTVGGAAVAMEVGVAAVGSAAELLNRIRSFRRFGSKFVPLIVTAAPGIAMAGVKPSMIGAPVGGTTVKLDELVVDPAGDVTEIGPVIAALGTVTSNWFDEAEITFAPAPPNCTVF
jgi:hypothetical protein